MKALFVTSQVISRHATMKRAHGLAPSLLRRGWDVTVLTEDHPDNREYFAEIRGLHCAFFAPGGARAESKAKHAFVRRDAYDLVHICGLGWRNAIRRQASSGLVLMDHVELESSLTGTPFIRRFAQWGLERWSRQHYRGAVVASRWLEQWHAVRPNQYVQYLPYGGNAVAPVLGERARAFAETKRLGRFVLYCGGLYRNYGFWTMLEAFVRLAEAQPAFRAVMLGRGPERDAGIAFIRERKLDQRILLPGFVPEEELDLYLNAAAAHVSPLNDTVTDRARCPSKIALYVMTGRPVVTCRIGEAVEYLGEHGIYFRPGDVDSLVHAVALGLARPPEPVPYDLARSDWEALATQYADFWEAKARRA